MGDKTGIGWTEATWNPTTGCDRVSPGCDRCYALSLAARHRVNPKMIEVGKYQRDGHWRTSGPGFGVDVRPDVLDQPLRWTRPRMIFVNSMSDLFHKDIPDDYVADVFAVMALAKWHTFQLLTKRHARMRSLLTSRDFQRMVGEKIKTRWDKDARVRERTGWMWNVDGSLPKWPLPNLWLGVSVEDETWAQRRIPYLLDTPAVLRFLSMEPLLGPVQLDMLVLPSPSAEDTPRAHGWDPKSEASPGAHNVFTDEWWPAEGDPAREYNNRVVGRFGATIDWVIVGGESGKDARPMKTDWVRSLRDQCRNHGVPYFFKQWGAHVPYGQMTPEAFSQYVIRHRGKGLDANAPVKMTPRSASNLIDGERIEQFPTLNPEGTS